MMERNSKQLGWIGLGNMGRAIAQNIQRHLAATNGPALKVWNRTASRAEPVVALGAKQAESIGQLARESDVIFISSSDDHAVEAIVEEILSSGDVTNKIVVDTTTIHPDTTKRIGGQLNESSAKFASAPMFGATPMAIEGKLLAAFSGPDDVFEVVSPFLKGVAAREVLRVSESPEKAMLLKTCGNFLIAGIMELVAEAHVFAEKTGLDAGVLEKLLELNFGALAHSDSTRMTTGVYMPGRDQSPWSDLNLALKDVGHGVNCAERAGTRLQVGELVLDHLKAAKSYSNELGGRAMDSSSMYGVIRQNAGLDFETDLVKKRDSA